MGWLDFRVVRRPALGAAVVLGCSLVSVAPLHAATVDCNSELGACTLTNVGMDQASCECTMATDGGIAGGSAWARLTDAELLLECTEFLASWCDPEPLPTTCADQTGTCSIEVEPDGFVCECADGSSPSGTGGDAWDGLDEGQLVDVCYEQLEICPPVAPKGGVLCEDSAGWCTVQNAPNDAFSCVCAGGAGTGYVGFDAWADYSQAQLMEICEDELDNACIGGGSTDTGTSGGGSTSDGSGDGTGGETGGSSSGDDAGVGSSDGTTGGDETTGGWRPIPTTGTGLDGGGGGDGGDDGGTTGGSGGDGTDGAPGATRPSAASGGCTVGGAPPPWGIALLLLFGVCRRRWC